MVIWALASVVSLSLPRDLEVLVVGTGPSGIMLSAALGGHWPYFTEESSKVMREIQLPGTMQCEPKRPPVRSPESNTDRPMLELLAKQVLQAKANTAARPKPKLPMLLEHLHSLAIGVSGAITGARSRNPIAVLFDQLWRPGSDTDLNSAVLFGFRSRHSDFIFQQEGGLPNGATPTPHVSEAERPAADISDVLQQPPCHLKPIARLVYKENGTLPVQSGRILGDLLSDPTLQTHRHFTHAVVGTETTGMGGSWQKMGPGLITLSPGEWMSLPGNYSLMQHYKEVLHERHRDGRLDSEIATVDGSPLNMCARIPRSVVTSYYAKYVQRMGLRNLYGGRKVVKAEREFCNASQCNWLVTLRDERKPYTSKVTVRANALVLAMGSYDVPRRLGIPGENIGPPLVHHRLWLPHQQVKQQQQASVLPRLPLLSSPLYLLFDVLVVGSGLSSADCIVRALHHGLRVAHVMRTPANQNKVIASVSYYNRLGYPGYYRVAQLMSGASPESMGLVTGQYQILPRSTLQSIERVRTQNVGARGRHVVIEPLKKNARNLTREDELGVLCTVVRSTVGATSKSSSGESTITRVVARRVAILIGAAPDLSFLPADVRKGMQRAVDKEYMEARNIKEDMIEKQGGKLDLRWDDGLNQPVFASVHPLSLQVQMIPQGQRSLVAVPGLYAVGPVRGDNFVRFLQGDSFAILRDLLSKDVA